MKSLLVANRGEIAVRVIRTAQEMGIRTIAIFSELDRDALHVDIADEAWNVGPAPAAESYLNQEAILRIAHEAGAEGIHPGYGFLSENAGFARAVHDAGIIWVGPHADAIEAMGDKITSRRHAEEFGVPTVPGITDPVTTVEEVIALAAQFGYPVAIKAAHGGGGKGLRVVQDEDSVVDAFEGARREADAYFGNPEVYVEKYLERPRHIEAQILFDTHGNGLFLGERDCSVQRRHQKLIEETPSPGLSPEQRSALGEAALSAARSCGYVNAGTVEFLVDQEGSFYFLEMNTRLQVEHTVTEMVTGIDLVEWQLRIAGGEQLTIGEVEPRGHAIEFRINAEDPFHGYLPSPGQVVEWQEPAGPGVRVDSWVRARHERHPVLRQPDGKAGGVGGRSRVGDQPGAPCPEGVHGHRCGHHDPCPSRRARPRGFHRRTSLHEVDGGRRRPGRPSALAWPRHSPPRRTSRSGTSRSRSAGDASGSRTGRRSRPWAVRSDVVHPS